MMLAHIRNLFSRLGYALLFFALARLVFFLFNAGTYATYGFVKIISTFFYGLLFDVSAIAYINSLFFLLSIIPWEKRAGTTYQLVLKILFTCTNGIALLLNLIDVEYIKFSGKRSGLELIQTNNEIGNLLGRYVADFWYMALIFLLLVWVMWRFYPKGYIVSRRQYTGKEYLQQTGLLVLCGGLWVIAARGGFYLKPIRPFDAGKFVQAELIPLTINTPFQFISTVGNQAPKVPDYFRNNEAEKIHPYVKQYKSEAEFEKKNVVLIILESFGKEYVGYFNNGKGYTPFLDSLSNQSLVFTNAFANGKKSIEALPSILSSIPSLLEMPFINSPYQTNKISGLGKLLKEQGYRTMFFHGARNGTMGFDGFIGASSYGDYLGLNEYTGDKIKNKSGPWGIDDGPYYEYVAARLHQTRQPFCATIFTLSSHHPYAVPAAWNSLPEGTLSIHKSVRYADLCLQQFFEQVSHEPWYHHSVFVITADHSAQNEQLKYQSMAGKYAVPLLIFDPQRPVKKEIDGTASHCDILPTVLHLLHYPDSFTCFGNSLLDSNATRGAVQYENGIYQYISLPWVLHFDGQKTIAVFNYHEDPLLQQNLLNSFPAATKNNLETELKALIQSFHQRLSKNSLTLP